MSGDRPSRQALRLPLILTGGPASGKSSSARMLATARERCAVVDVDDVRQLVVAGARAPWDGSEGARQRSLGVRNACSLVGNFRSEGFEVVVADVLTPETTRDYRALLGACVVVHLVVSLEEARHRATQRSVWLTSAEFDQLHAADRDWPPEADARLLVDQLDLPTQVACIDQLWAAGGRS